MTDHPDSSDSYREFLREELGRARQGDDTRADLTLIGAPELFRDWLRPMMALGRIPRGVIDTMVQKGVTDGLARDEALRLVREVAAACGARLERPDT